MFNLTGTGKQKREIQQPYMHDRQDGMTENVTNAERNSAANGNMTDCREERRIEEIEAQRQAFAAKNPGFDMRTEIQNPEFVNYVWGNNLSVEDAYFLVHRDEIFDHIRAEAIEEFNARRNRIPENGAAKNRPAITSKNPSDLTDKEVDDIIERARKGEKIKF